MDKIKNYAIAVLTGLLALSLFIQPAQSAPAKSIEAKAMEYLFCLNSKSLSYTDNQYLDEHIKKCVKYRP
jgi:hypothetical protein